MDKPEERARRIAELVNKCGDPDEAALVCDKLQRGFERLKHHLPA